MVQSPGFGEGNGLDNASGTATKNTRAPHKEPATRMAEREIWSAEIVARDARIPNPALLSDDPSSPAPRVGPQRCGPAPTSLTMVVQLDYFGVNRRPAARTGGSLAVPLEPFGAPPPHVVQFRPIAARLPQTRKDVENGQEIHPRTPT